jgi:hypothetical protein
MKTATEIETALDGHPVADWVLAVHQGPVIEVDCEGCNEVHVVVLCQDCGVAGAIDSDELGDPSELCGTLAEIVAVLGLSPPG